MMWGTDMVGWSWGWFGLVHMVLWWFLIILGIVVLVRWLMGSGGDRRAADGDRALSILRERYARGEIDKAEFEARERDLAH